MIIGISSIFVHQNKRRVKVASREPMKRRTKRPVGLVRGISRANQSNLIRTESQNSQFKRRMSVCCFVLCTYMLNERSHVAC